MEMKNLLGNFEQCLEKGDLEPMHKDLYNFFHLRCGFIAHYDIGGFRGAYHEPEHFGYFLQKLKMELEEDLKQAAWSEDCTDNTDSFKYGYNFRIPELKREMLELIFIHKPTLDIKLRNQYIEQLERQKLAVEHELVTLKQQKRAQAVGGNGQ